MRKLHLILTALFAIAMQGHAQKFIDFYQEGQVTRSLLTSDIDSITITGAELSMRRINIWRSGKVTESFSATAVDTIIVYHPEDEPLIYLGIIGFNKSLYPKAIDILANSTSPLYSNFVSHLTREDGSLLYYSVDQALDMLTKHPFSTPLSSVNLITFTDGLDQDSPQMTAKNPDGNDYLIALSQRIGSTLVQGLPLTAYCLGLHGDDVTDDVQFQSNLRQLATSDENAIEVKSMSAVQLSATTKMPQPTHQEQLLCSCSTVPAHLVRISAICKPTSMPLSPVWPTMRPIFPSSPPQTCR